MRRCGVIVAGRQVNVARPRLMHLRSAFCRTQNTRTTQKRTRTLVCRHPDGSEGVATCKIRVQRRVNSYSFREINLPSSQPTLSYRVGVFKRNILFACRSFTSHCFSLDMATALGQRPKGLRAFTLNTNYHE